MEDIVLDRMRKWIVADLGPDFKSDPTKLKARVLFYIDLIDVSPDILTDYEKQTLCRYFLDRL